MYLLDICLPSFEKYPFMSSAYILIGLFCFFNIISLAIQLFLFIYFLAVPRGMQNLSSPTGDQTHTPCGGSKHAVLTLGPPGKSLKIILINVVPFVYLCFCLSCLSRYIQTNIVKTDNKELNACVFFKKFYGFMASSLTFKSWIHCVYFCI